MSKTVLLVDDSVLVRKVLSFQLKGAGYTILTGVDGDDALSHFDGKDIDLVITDLNMPNKNGLQLISEIRSMDYYRFMPVILFISDDGIDISETLKNSGATILFDKNNIKEKFIPTVKKMIG